MTITNLVELALRIGPILASAVLVLTAWIVARDQAGVELYLRESSIIVTELGNLIPLGLVIILFYVQLLVSRHQEWQGLTLNIVEFGLMFLLLCYLGKMIVSFCGGKLRLSDGVSALLQRARHEKLRRTRRRFLMCLLFYYLAGVLVVIGVFADYYHLKTHSFKNWRDDPVAVDLHLLVVSRMKSPMESPNRHGNLDLENEAQIVGRLSAFMRQNPGGLSLDIGTPGAMDSFELREALEAITAEAMHAAHIDNSTTQITFHHSHACDESPQMECPVLLHVSPNSERPPFANYSDQYGDALLMSAMTLVTVGLSDNAPVASIVKMAVILEQFCGLLFFSVCLSGLFTTLIE